MSGSDEGAAVAEFALISTLVLFLVFAVLQVALYCYARNVVTAATADAVRFAAAAGTGPEAGRRRAERLIADGLGPRFAAKVVCTASRDRYPAGADELDVTTVRCHTRLSGVGLSLSLDARSSALTETPPP